MDELDDIMGDLEESIDSDDEYEAKIEVPMDHIDDIDLDMEMDDEEFQAELEALERELEPDEEDLELDIFECPICNSEVDEDTPSCPFCGAVLDDELFHVIDALEAEKEDEHLQEEPIIEMELPIKVTPSAEELELEEDFLEAIKEAKKELAGLRKESISVDVLKEFIQKANKAKDKGDYRQGIKYCIQVIELGENMRDFLKKVLVMEKEITTLKNHDVPYKDLLQRSNKAKNTIEEGSAKDGLLEQNSILKDIKTRKERIKTAKGSKNELDEVVSKLNIHLNSAKLINLQLMEERVLITEALSASKGGNIDKALEKLHSALDNSSEKLENRLSELIEEAELEIIEYDEIEKEEYEKRLGESRKTLSMKQFHQTAKLLGEIRGGMKDMKQPVKRPGFEAVEELIINAKTLGIDCTKSEGFLFDAKADYDLGDMAESKINLKRATDNLVRNMPSKIQGIMKDGLKELETARRDGKDISKPVVHLKQSNLLLKRREYLKALKHIVIFNRLMDDLLKREEKTLHRPMEIIRPSPAIDETEMKEVKKTESPMTSEVQRDNILPDRLEESCTYMVIEKRSDKAFILFKKMFTQGMKGICITRQYPTKIRSKFGLEDTVILWLSNVEKKDTFRPENLEKLSLELEIFLGKGKGIILLDGLEYLIYNNDFRTVLHLIQSIKDRVTVTDSILILAVSDLTLEKHQIELLDKEVDETFRF